MEIQYLEVIVNLKVPKNSEIEVFVGFNDDWNIEKQDFRKTFTNGRVTKISFGFHSSFAFQPKLYISYCAKGSQKKPFYQQNHKKIFALTQTKNIFYWNN